MPQHPSHLPTATARLIVAAAAVLGLCLPPSAAHAALKQATSNKATADAAKPAGLNLIPWPKALRVSQDAPNLSLTRNSRVVAMAEELKPLAALLSEEIFLASGLRVAAGAGKPVKGDIVLQLNRSLQADTKILTVRDLKVVKTRDGAHTLTVDDRALVEGFDYRAVAEGTATLLQALRIVPGRSLALPRMTVKDWPHSDFNGVMVDCGRQNIPIEALQQMVETCRLYKVRYLHLHLSDDQGFTFPSQAFPKLGTRNDAAHGGIPPKVYDLKQLKALVAYADARAVTLVPELETPGHSGAMRLAMPELFDAPKTPGGGAWLAVMNMANDEIYPALDTLVGEMCDVFKSSPYFHIGGDECNLNLLASLPQTTAYLKQNKLNGMGELFVQHNKRMNEIVKKHGKKTLVWEGAGLDASLKDDVIVYPWVGDSSAATSYQKQGFTTITVPWTLGVPVEQWNMYVCNASRLARSDRVLGALLPMWEMNAEALINTYRLGIPTRQERTWGPDNQFTVAEFEARAAATEILVKKLIFPPPK